MPFAAPRIAQTNWADFVVFGAGAVAFASGMANSVPWLSAAGVGAAALSMLKWRSYRWAQAASLFLGGIMALWAARLGAQSGMSLHRGLELASGCVLVGISLRQLRGWSIDRPPVASDSIFSLVLLERAPRYLDASVVTHIAQDAWTDQKAGDEDRPIVSGDVPTFLIETSEACYLVHIVDEPFWETAADVADYLSDLRAQRAVVEHRAWIAVDVLKASDEADPHDVRQRAGQLAAEIAGASTLAVFDPASGAFQLWSDAVSALLRQGAPEKCFCLSHAVAVVSLSPDDPHLARAIAEARRRWPEFAAAFASRHPEQHFSVKAPVTREGRTEHIWIEVAHLSEEQVEGRLGNAPVDLGDLHLGDPISVPTDSVEDWLYVLTDKPVGGFTIPVVSAAHQRPKRR